MHTLRKNEQSILSLVYATFWSIVTILKEPVMLLCLLLVAKGWCITRHFLHRREVCIAGTILALLYASVSVQMSLQSPLATIPMVIMYLAMLVEISWSIFNNLRILKAQASNHNPTQHSHHSLLPLTTHHTPLPFPPVCSSSRYAP